MSSLPVMKFQQATGLHLNMQPENVGILVGLNIVLQHSRQA